MLSDNSELTELPSSDDNYTKAPKKSQAATKKAGYRLRNVLKPGRTTQYTAKALYDQIHDGDIDLNPDYQRDVVWSDAKQIGLIDSIFRNFYVPPIIFSVTTEEDGTEKRTCIDGKQRLTSISKFISGIIPHRDPFTNEKLWFVDNKSGSKRNLLPSPYKSMFQNKQIVCIEYSDLPPDFEREVFQRVQMGMALTTAEKMQAITGPWPDFVREIHSKYYLGKDGIAGNIDMDMSRARDFQNLAQTLYCIDSLPSHIQGTTMQIEKWLAKDGGPSEATRTQIHDVFRIYRDLTNHKQLKAPLKKPSRVAPAEFIMAGVLIAVHKDKLSLPQLSQAIGILRAETRSIHEDVRTNGKVFKTMFGVISEKVNASGLKDTPGQATAGTGSKLYKRKRAERSSGDSSEAGGGNDADAYRPRATKSRAPPTEATSRSEPEPAKPVGKAPSPVSRVKTEDSRPATSLATATQPGSAISRPPHTGSSGLAKIQAAKAHAASLRNETWSGFQNTTPPDPTIVHQAPNTTVAYQSLPPQQSHPPFPPHPGFIPRNHSNTSIDTIMMHSSAHPTYLPAPYPTPLNHSSIPSQPAAQNGSHGIPIPMTVNSSDLYQSSTLGTSHSDYRSHDSYRQNGSRDEHGDGSGYRGGRGYDERTGRDPDRDYRDRDRDREKDRGSNRDHDDSRSRSSYSTRPEGYHKSRDHGWDRKVDRDIRRSSFKDR